MGPPEGGYILTKAGIREKFIRYSELEMSLRKVNPFSESIKS